MRKLISLMHISLDGYVAGPKGEMDWIQHGDQAWEFVDRHISQADAGLYGPVTFGMMESYWPEVLKNPDAQGHGYTHARWYAQASKYVCSTKLQKLDNPQATLIKDKLVQQITALKQQPGKNIILFGSPHLVHSLTGLGLIDEYVLTLNPVLLGGGTPLFVETSQRSKLHRASVVDMTNGALGLHYLHQAD